MNLDGHSLRIGVEWAWEETFRGAAAHCQGWSWSPTRDTVRPTVREYINSNCSRSNYCTCTILTCYRIPCTLLHCTAPGSYFTSLHYSPAKVERDVLGDADLCSLARRERFEKRQKRTQANIAMSKAQRELEELLLLTRMEKRQQSKAKGRLRYESALYLEDMQRLEKKPLDKMQKKGNPKQYELIWGGSQKLGGAQGQSSEGCKGEFATTYASSFCPETSSMSDI